MAFKSLVWELRRSLARKDLNDAFEKLKTEELRLIHIAVEGQLSLRRQEREHFAHLSRTSDSPDCELCRQAAAARRDV